MEFIGPDIANGGLTCSGRIIVYTIISIISERASLRIGKVADRLDIKDGPGTERVEGFGIAEFCV